ncbi:MAG: ABC transporter permease [Actinomycetota bacterium]
MGKLTVASIKMLYRDKQALFWAMAFPVIFAVVFGLFDFSQEPEVDIAVVRSVESPVSGEIVRGLREFESFTVVTSRDLADQRRALDDGRVGVVIAVPEGASSKPLRPGSEASPPRETVQVFYNQSNFDSNQFALGAIQRLVDGMNLRLAGVSSPPLRVQEEAVVGRSIEYYDFLLPGLVAMGVMTFSIIGMSVAITRFREQQILRRILATPLRPLKFLSAQVLARLLLALVQAALILAVGVFLFGANVYGNVAWLFVLATLANLIFLNIGFAVAGRASNPDAAQGIGNAVALPMMFLSGVFFPTDTLPQVMQTVVKFLPLTPLIEAMRKVSLEGLSITATGPQLLQLGIWVVVSFLVASRMFRFARA